MTRRSLKGRSFLMARIRKLDQGAQAWADCSICHGLIPDWTHQCRSLEIRCACRIKSTDIDPEPEKYFLKPGSGLVNLVILVNCVPDLGGCLQEPGALPNVPGCVINCGSGPEELPPGDNEVLSECDGRIDMVIHEGFPGRHGTWRKLSDNSSDPEGWTVLIDRDWPWWTLCCRLTGTPGDQFRTWVEL